jgi:hypothetical protein
MAKKKQHKKITKLSERAKHEINRAPFKGRADDYAGQAKAYLTRQRNKAKIRTAEKKGYVHFGNMLIPGNSEAYKFIEVIAAQKKMTVKQVARKYQKELKPLLVDNRFPIRREVENLIDDVSVAVGSVFINGKKASKTQAKFLLNKNTAEIKNVTGAFAVIPKVEVTFKGNMYIEFPEKLPTMHVRGRKPTADEVLDYESEVENFLDDNDINIIVSKDDD